MDRKYEHSVSFWVFVITLTFLFGVVIDSFSSFHEECRNLQEDVLRLHILANSDSEQDQAVKLKVRDALLAQTGTLFNHAENRSDAEEAARANLQNVEKIADEVLQSEGVSYKANARVTELFFDTRVYENFTMPAGRYQALQITLGNGEGHNWWCVLYPPLCVGAASEIEEEMQTFSSGERQILEAEPKYEVRFYFMELAGRIGEWIEDARSRKAE
ncbi:MAG: stage II sporulation protein R [Candidatus Merdivicinus sp.]|jgi:stage II sporulation protein R